MAMEYESKLLRAAEDFVGQFAQQNPNHPDLEYMRTDVAAREARIRLFTSISTSKEKTQEQLPEPSPQILKVYKILADKGFKVEQIAFVDDEKKEVTHAVIETVRRPDYTDGTQMYYPNPDKDPLSEILERGRSTQKIAVPDWTRHVPANSRFGLSWLEIHHSVFPEVIKTTPDLEDILNEGRIGFREVTR